jgi:hypothetical protein
VSTLILAPRRNTGAKLDATAGFHPSARRFMQLRGGTIVHIDNTYPGDRRAEHVLDELLRMRPGETESSPRLPWKNIAFFCHGTARGLQLGFDLRNVRDLARAIAQSSEANVRVLLYACDAGSSLPRLLALGKGPGGDGGFADVLRDHLCREGAVDCRVMAHETTGHTTRNPWVRFFDGKGSSVGGTGGEYPVAPRSFLWQRWREALQSDFRFHFPFLAIADIHRVLTSNEHLATTIDA